MPALGGAERRVASMDVAVAAIGAREVSVLAWTPDGKRLAVGGRPLPAEANGIWLVDVEDGKTPAFDGGARAALRRDW